MAQVEGQLLQDQPIRDGVELSRPISVDDHADDGLIEDVLVEEVSIDGMCGVY